MSVNELSLPVGRENVDVCNRLFGILAMLGAPMLLVQFLAGNRQLSSENAFVAVLGVFYMGGWIFGAVGMFRQNAYGRQLSRRIVFGLQMLLLALGCSFSVLDTLGYNFENLGLIFAITDAGYPLSHLFMIVIGLVVWRAGIWRGVSKAAPFIVGFALPSMLALGILVGAEISSIMFASLNALGLGTIGWTVFRKSAEA